MTRELTALNDGSRPEIRRAPGGVVPVSVPRLGQGISAALVGVLTLLIRVYQLTISPAQTFLFGATGGCRYTPSCSTYAVGALREHGAGRGSVLTVKRICRCHPWGGCGHDPVPSRNLKAETEISPFI